MPRNPFGHVRRFERRHLRRLDKWPRKKLKIVGMPFDKPKDCRDALANATADSLVDAELKLIQIQALVLNGSPQSL